MEKTDHDHQLEAPGVAFVNRPSCSNDILYAVADLARYIVQVEDVAALLSCQGLADADADCSDLEEMDK